MGPVTEQESERNIISMPGLMILLGTGSPTSMRTVTPVKLHRAGRSPFGSLLKKLQLNLSPQHPRQQLLAEKPGRGFMNVGTAENYFNSALNKRLPIQEDTQEGTK